MSEAKRRSTSRGVFVAGAARREFALRDPAAVRAAVERSERRFAIAPSFESTDLVRAERDGCR